MGADTQPFSFIAQDLCGADSGIDAPAADRLRRMVQQEIQPAWTAFSESHQIDSVPRGYLFEGRRADLTGGGLSRSFGGWTALKALRKAGLRVKGDERILGDSDFVTDVLKIASETLEQKYDLITKGYDFNRAVGGVAQVLDMDPDDATAYGKSPQTVQARALLCYWAHRKLGMTTVEISRKLNLCQSAVSRLSTRGEKMADEKELDLIERKA